MVPPCRRIRLAGAEALYAKMLPSRKGHPAFPFRMAPGALVIQKRMRLSDRALARAVAENPCYQYFIGMQAFSSRCPFTYSTLAVFRRRLTQDLLMKVNELFLATAGPMAEHGGGKRMVKREEWRDDVARNEAERFFSSEKRACDAALIVAKLACAAFAGMALSVLVANLFGVPLPCGVFYCLFSGRSGKHSGMAFLRVFGLRGGGRVTSGNALSRAMDRGEARRKDAYRGWHPCSF